MRVADVQVQVDDYVNGFNPNNTIDTSFRLDDDTKMSPKVGLTWRPNDDWMVYGIWSHGFRPGIVQGAVVDRITQVEPTVALPRLLTICITFWSTSRPSRAIRPRAWNSV